MGELPRLSPELAKSIGDALERELSPKPYDLLTIDEDGKTVPTNLFERILASPNSPIVIHSREGK